MKNKVNRVALSIIIMALFSACGDSSSNKAPHEISKKTAPATAVEIQNNYK